MSCAACHYGFPCTANAEEPPTSCSGYHVMMCTQPATPLHATRHSQLTAGNIYSPPPLPR